MKTDLLAMLTARRDEIVRDAVSLELASPERRSDIENLVNKGRAFSQVIADLESVPELASVA